MSQAVYRGSPRRPVSSQRSGAVAAILSFLFPGLGQAYLGRRREALILAVPVLVLLMVLVVWLVSSGLTRAGARLLDPSVAVYAAVLSAIVVVWWAAAIILAWRAGHHSSRSVVVPVALVVILLVASVWDHVPLGASWLYSLSVADRGFDNGQDCTISACDTGDTQVVIPSYAAITPPPVASGASSPSSSAAGSASASGTPGASDDYNDYGQDPSEAPATPVPGQTPNFDITKLDAQDDGWLNVLLIGLDTRCAGGIVTGANTDTMIVVSVNTSNGNVYMFSFPRDTAQFPLYTGGTMPGYWKLNSFAGYTKLYPNIFPDPGQPALAYEIGFLLGIPIDYYASINICGFPQLIDQLGGVDVCNSKLIDDPSYPWGNGQLGFHLNPGEYHMNGATALAFARSRHGSSDFARARRQQQLITAIRQAVLQPQNLANLPAIVAAMSDVVHTDFPPDQINQLLSLSNQIDATPTAQYVFEFPDWAQHLQRLQTNGRSVQFLDMDKLATLSYQIYGNASLYAKNGPVPSVPLPQPTPSASPAPGATSVC